MKPVMVKITRPEIKPGNNWNEVTAVVIDEQGNPITAAWTSKMRLRAIRTLFGNSHMAYYLAEWTQGEPVRLVQPIRLEDWE